MSLEELRDSDSELDVDLSNPITLPLLRQKSEHNAGDLASLEEVSLHQLHLTAIGPQLARACRRLRILYVQNNLIAQIAHISRLKRLEYLNISVNNLQWISGLHGCESLNKLDCTLNFVSVEFLGQSVAHLAAVRTLRELFFSGNPCTTWKHYRAYVVALLPQLRELDGTEITRSERIVAKQELDAAAADLAAEAMRCRAERLEREAAGYDPSDESAYTPEDRLHMRKEELLEERRREREAEASERRYAKPHDQWKEAQKRLAEKVQPPSDGSLPSQRNVKKVPLVIRSSEDGKAVVVDVAVPRYLDTSALDVDVHPRWFQVVWKGNNVLMHTPEEVSPGQAKVQRLKHNGHLVLTLPTVKPIVSAFEQVIDMDAPPPPPQAAAEPAAGVRPLKYERDRERVTFRNIVKKDEDEEEDEEELMRQVAEYRSARLEEERRAKETQQQEDSGDESSDFEDDEDVPPLE